MQTAYDFLAGSQSKYISVDASQKNIIQSWCKEYRGNLKLVWFFLHSLDLQLPEDIVLDLTFYYDFNHEAKLQETGTIEMLEKFADIKAIRQKVAANLKAGLPNPSVWKANAGYAIRNNITEGYPFILQQLEAITGDIYRWNGVLELWFQTTENSQRLRIFTEQALSIELKWVALRLLADKRKEFAFTLQYVTRIMNDSLQEMNERLRAARFLTTLDDESGFTFLANHVLNNPNPDFDFGTWLHFGNYTRVSGIPLLMELLLLSKQPAFTLDRYNNLEARVNDALYAIGSRSKVSFALVKTALENFIEAYEDRIEGLQYLQYNIAHMEERLNATLSKEYTVDTALKEYFKTVV